MPCALTSNFGYPDYIKRILKQIEVGKDEELKDCACKLKTPLTDEGCPILDEDNKLGLFPFCVPDAETEGEVGDNTQYPLKLTLKKAMELYWTVKKWNLRSTGGFNVRPTTAVCCRPSPPNPPGTFVCGKSDGGFSPYYALNINFQRAGEMLPGQFYPNPKYQRQLVCFGAPNYFGTIGNSEFFTNVNADQFGFSIFLKNDFIGIVPMKKKKEGNKYYFYPSINVYWSYPALAGTPPFCATGTCGQFAHEYKIIGFPNSDGETIKSIYEEGECCCPHPCNEPCPRIIARQLDFKAIPIEYWV